MSAGGPVVLAMECAPIADVVPYLGRAGQSARLGSLSDRENIGKFL